MKNLLIILFVGAVAFGCNSKEYETEQLKLNKTYFNFAVEKGRLYRSWMEKTKAEGGNKGFFEKHYGNILAIDSSLEGTYNLLDSFISKDESIGLDSAYSSYDETLKLIENELVRFEEDYEERPFRSDYNLIKNLDAKLILSKLKVDLAISHANYLQVLYYFIEGNCGFRTLDITSNSHIDSMGNVKIYLGSEGIQQIPQGRKLVLDKITRNGKVIKTEFEFQKDYTFSTLRIDSLEKGSYIIEGKVEYYTMKGLRQYPFKENLIIR